MSEHHSRTNRRTIIALIATALAIALIGAGVAMYAFRPDMSVETSHGPPRPAAGTPRGVMWDVWNAAANDDRNTIVAAMMTTTDGEGKCAEAMADLLIAQAAFARQLQHTWPMSPTSRDGANTWFGEGADAGLLSARESIDAAAINATVNMQGTPVKLIRSSGAWKIDTAELVRTQLKLARDADLSMAPQRLQTMANAYESVRRDIPARRIASPSAAMEKLRAAMTATVTKPS